MCSWWCIYCRFGYVVSQRKCDLEPVCFLSFISFSDFLGSYLDGVEHLSLFWSQYEWPRHIIPNKRWNPRNSPETWSDQRFQRTHCLAQPRDYRRIEGDCCFSFFFYYNHISTNKDIPLC